MYVHSGLGYNFVDNAYNKKSVCDILMSTDKFLFFAQFILSKCVVHVNKLANEKGELITTHLPC